MKALHHDLWGDIVEKYANGDYGLKFSFVRDDGNTNEENLSFYFRDNPIPKEIDSKLYSIDNICDLGCGTGIFLRELMKYGKRCFGIELSPKCASVARKISGTKVFVGDMGTIRTLEDASVGAFLMAGNNLGLFEDIEKLRIFLLLAKMKLKRGGKLVAHSIDPTTTIKEHLAYQARNIENNLYIGRIQLHIEYDNLCSPPWTLNLVEKRVILNLLKESGYQEIEIINVDVGYYICATCNN
jgi:SAM-dependent methyltransferase